jgi:hypothetical protein
MDRRGRGKPRPEGQAAPVDPPSILGVRAGWDKARGGPGPSPACAMAGWRPAQRASAGRFTNPSYGPSGDFRPKMDVSPIPID